VLRDVPNRRIVTRWNLTYFTMAGREFMLSRLCWRIARAGARSSL